MGEYNIFRPLTENEQNYASPITKNNLMNTFLKEVSKKVAEYQGLKKPYDSYGARMDFEDKDSDSLMETLID